MSTYTPLAKQAPAKRFTISDAAKALYPNRTFDTALPAPWVRRMKERGFNPVGHFVSLYPQPGDQNLGFYMAPITMEGVEMAARVCSMHA